MPAFGSEKNEKKRGKWSKKMKGKKRRKVSSVNGAVKKTE